MQTMALSAGALAAAGCNTFAAAPRWPIACFNRPWMQKYNGGVEEISTLQPADWGLSKSLAGIRQAGYKTAGLLTPHPEDPFIGITATDQYMAHLREQIAASGLTVNMAALHVQPHLPRPQALAGCRSQIDRAASLKVKWLLTFGVDRAQDYDNYFYMMADAADYAHAAGINLVLKPHGGGSGAAEEIKRCLSKVNRPNFKVWYDAGNIIYYTGRDPVEELKPIVENVTGFCAKDCSGKNGEVMIQFGTGKVDFAAVYRELKRGGFNGPSYVECAGGKTFAEITEGARANRLFLEKIFAEL